MEITAGRALIGKREDVGPVTNISLYRRMRRPAVKIARVLLRRELAGRRYTPYSDDVCLVAYPRSGGTWLRFLTGTLVHPENPVTFANLESTVPSIYHRPDWLLLRAARPRILKSHESYYSRHQKVIYIVRDPRDVAVSYYHYVIKYRELPSGYPMADYVPRFMREDFEAQFGPWNDHVSSWLQMRQGQPDFLFLRYEDLLADPMTELGRIADFMGITATTSRLRQVISLSSSDHMRQLEREQSRQWSGTRKSRQDMFFVRSAKSGAWKQELPAESVRLIESSWGPVMQTLRYPLSRALAAECASAGSTLPAGKADHSDGIHAGANIPGRVIQ